MRFLAYLQNAFHLEEFVASLGNFNGHSPLHHFLL